MAPGLHALPPPLCRQQFSLLSQWFWPLSLSACSSVAGDLGRPGSLQLGLSKAVTLREGGGSAGSSSTGKHLSLRWRFALLPAAWQHARLSSPFPVHLPRAVPCLTRSGAAKRLPVGKACNPGSLLLGPRAPCLFPYKQIPQDDKQQGAPENPQVRVSSLQRRRMQV